MIEPNSDLPEFELRDVSAEKAQEPAQSGGCGCDHGAQLPRLDARPFPPPPPPPPPPRRASPTSVPAPAR